MSGSRRALGLAVVLLVGGALIASLLGEERRRFAPETARPASGELSTLKQVLGTVSYEARRVVAGMLYLRLDSYVHEGPRIQGESGRWGTSMVTNLDIVPLYRLITILDPHFIEAYSLASTHLSGGLNRIDDAIAILEEGIRENPNQPRISELEAQLGATYIRDRQDYANARPHLERALLILERFGEGYMGPVDLYRTEMVRGMLLNDCYRLGDLRTAAILARKPHGLVKDHPALLALEKAGLAGEVNAGAPPAPVDPSRNVKTGSPPPAKHHHVDGDECEEDHDHGNAAASALEMTDLHHRPWMEPGRLANARWQTEVAGGVFAALLAVLGGRRWWRRRPAPLAACVLALALARPALAGPAPETVSFITSYIVEWFLLFVVLVAIILVLVLNHLVRRGKRLEMLGHEKLFGFVEEALRTNPSDQKHLEVAALSFENGLYERALSYVAKVSDRDPALKMQAQYYELLALLGLARLDEATALYDKVPLDKLTAAQQYRIARAWKEHNLLARAKGLFLKVFLTDIAFADVSQQLEEISSIEKQQGGASPEFLARAVSPRYRDVHVVRERERELVCLAFDRDLGRNVRLRVLRPDRASDASVREFLDEAALMSQLRHPAVLQTYDVQKERLPFVSYEDFEGRTLAEHSAGLATGERIELAARLVGLERELVGEGRPFACLPKGCLAVGQDGTVRVCRAPQTPEPPVGALADALAEVLPAGDADEFVAGGVARVRTLLSGARTGDAAAFVLATEAAAAELAQVDAFVKLSEAERERQGLLAHLRWLDGLHRSKVHSLKSKFAVCERYRDEPAKLVRAFFRTANLEEVCRMLASLEEMIGEMDRLPPCKHPAIPRLVRLLEDADLAGQRRALAEVMAAGAEPDAATRARMDRLADTLPRNFEQFKDLSVAISRVVEEFELDLVRVVEMAVAASAYGHQVKLDAAGGDGRVRVADTAEFRRELSLALDNLISNSFEAQASAVEIEIRRVEAQGFRILLRDDGSGVPEDLLERIRTARYTSKAGGTSTGILSAKALVEKHRGRFEIRPRANAPGTEVTLLIPAA